MIQGKRKREREEGWKAVHSLLCSVQSKVQGYNSNLTKTLKCSTNKQSGRDKDKDPILYSVTFDTAYYEMYTKEVGSQTKRQHNITLTWCPALDEPVLGFVPPAPLCPERQTTFRSIEKEQMQFSFNYTRPKCIMYSVPLRAKPSVSDI